MKTVQNIPKLLRAMVVREEGSLTLWHSSTTTALQDTCTHQRPVWSVDYGNKENGKRLDLEKRREVTGGRFYESELISS